MWAAGVAASPLDALLDRAGRVKVNPDLTVPGQTDIFVAGDLALVATLDGKAVPGVAPAAKQMGRYVARLIGDRLAAGGASAAATAGKPGKPFAYADYGNLVTIGRMAAVVDLRGWKFSDWPTSEGSSFKRPFSFPMAPRTRRPTRLSRSLKVAEIR